MAYEAIWPCGQVDGQEILTKVLEEEPDIIAMQEVVPAMYEVIVRRLKIEKSWAEVRRWGEVSEDYFNVTAVKSKPHGNEDRASFYSYRSSNNGRHLITAVSYTHLTLPTKRIV